MDEDISIISTRTRNEKIKNFFVKNKKNLIIISLFIFSFVFIILLSNKKYNANGEYVLSFDSTILINSVSIFVLFPDKKLIVK